MCVNPRFVSSIALALISVVAVQPVHSETYYVDQKNPIASDANPGSESKPWLSLYPTTRMNLTPGDTVVVRPGVYVSGMGDDKQKSMIDPKTSGAPGRPITFIAQPRLAASIDGEGQLSAPIHINGQSHIVIDGFRVTQAVAAGIVVSGEKTSPLTDIVIKNTIISDIRNRFAAADTDGIRVSNANDVLIHNNQISSIYDGALSDNAAGIKTYNVQRVHITNNNISGATTGIYVKGAANEIEIQQNLVEKAEVGLTIASTEQSRAREIHVNENIFNQNEVSLQLEAEDGAELGISIFNNDFVNYAVAAVSVSQGSFGDVGLWNNIFDRGPASKYFIGEVFTYDDPPRSINMMNFNLYTSEPVFVTGLYSSNKMVDSLTIWSPYSSLDYNSMVGPANFEDPQNNNFQLKGSSIALNRGHHQGELSGAPESIGVYPRGPALIGYQPESAATATASLKRPAAPAEKVVTKAKSSSTKAQNTASTIEIITAMPTSSNADAVTTESTSSSDKQAKPETKVEAKAKPKAKSKKQAKAEVKPKPATQTQAKITTTAAIQTQSVAKPVTNEKDKPIELAKLTPPESAAPLKKPGKLEWEIRHDLSFNGECVMESNKIDFFDGEDNTGLKMRVYDDGLYLLTKSNIDISFNDIGIQVGTNELLHADSVVNYQGVLLKVTLPKLLQQLKSTQTAKVQLRFWPTYPATHTYSEMVNLDGFLSAYDNYQACKRGK